MKTPGSPEVKVEPFVCAPASVNTVRILLCVCYMTERTPSSARLIFAELKRRRSIIPDTKNKTNDEVNRHSEALSCPETVQYKVIITRLLILLHVVTR